MTHPRTKMGDQQGAARGRAFTLIELLVVVTIMVVLLALLTPAIDRAMYQAELTVCEAKLDGVGTAFITYAVGSGRHYPALPIGMASNNYAHYLSWQGNPDNRPMLGDHVGLPINRTFLCPLSDAVDLEGSLSTSIVQGSYDLWPAFRYADPPGQSGMYRMGDRFSYTDSAGERHRFSLLANDMDSSLNATHMQNAHPDDKGVTASLARQDDGTPPFQSTYSFWYGYDATAGDRPRGGVDGNFLYADGSVRRLLSIPLSGDERITPVPSTAAGPGSQWFTNLPVE
jgi:prepilin-type N-terminal cleavage/methylation domain-containing protein/prepilin-type processing-associated H-X9-DG protein